MKTLYSLKFILIIILLSGCRNTQEKSSISSEIIDRQIEIAISQLNGKYNVYPEILDPYIKRSEEIQLAVKNIITDLGESSNSIEETNVIKRLNDFVKYDIKSFINKKNFDEIFGNFLTNINDPDFDIKSNKLQIMQLIKHIELYALNSILEEIYSDFIVFKKMKAELISNKKSTMLGEEFQARVYLIPDDTLIRSNVYIGIADTFTFSKMDQFEKLKSDNNSYSFHFKPEKKGKLKISGAYYYYHPRGVVICFPFSSQIIVE